MKNITCSLASVLFLIGCEGNSVQAENHAERKVFVSYYDVVDAVMRQYEVPRFATIETYSSHVDGAKRIVTVEFAAEPPADGNDPFMIEVFFGEGPGQYTKCLAAVVGPAPYPSVPQVERGRAAVVELSSGKVLGWGELETDGRTIRASVTQEAIGGATIRLALTRYAPARLYPSRIEFGSEAVSEILFRHAEDARLKTALPSHPD